MERKVQLRVSNRYGQVYKKDTSSNYAHRFSIVLKIEQHGDI
jgi:hypothetical protein